MRAKSNALAKPERPADWWQQIYHAWDSSVEGTLRQEMDRLDLVRRGYRAGEGILPGFRDLPNSRTLARYRKAVGVALEHAHLLNAAMHRVRKLQDEYNLANLAEALEDTDAKRLERNESAALKALEALPEPPVIPGITAQEAAARYGYSREGARGALERGVRDHLLEKRNELRSGKWSVVYAPTEQAAAVMTRKALPAGT